MGHATRETTPDTNGLYTTGRIAALTGVSPRVAQMWVDTGLLKGHRLPTGRRRVYPEDLRDFLARHPELGVTIP